MGLDFMSFTGLLKLMVCCQIEEASLRAMSLVSQVLASYGLMGLNTEQPDQIIFIEVNVPILLSD